MSNVRYNAGTMTIEVDGLDDVSAVLGDLRKKTPAVAKVAINATARQARKLMIAEAKARYAVNSAGKRHLSDLVQRKKASNSSLSAELRIASYRNDLGYFQTRPNRPFVGHDVAQAPEYFTARVLKTSPMKALTGKGRLSKGFLVEFKSGHVGMVQRIVGTGRFHYTVRSGAPSTSDKMQTMGSPSAAAMHSTIWPEVEPEVELFLAAKLTERAEQVLACLLYTSPSPLIEMLRELFAGKKYNGQEGRKPLAIFKQDLPIPEENDVDADTDVAHAPYIVVRMTGGEIADDKSPQTVEFSLIICAYDTGIERAGFQDVANIKEDIVQRACTAPYFGGAFTILKPIAWALQQDDTAPYYYGAVTMNCTAPAMTQDTELEELL
mgnify:CR=1 FL=1